MPEPSPPETPGSMRSWVWRAVYLGALVGMAVASLATRRHALTLMGGGGIVLLAASVLLSPREKSLLVEDVLLGAPAGLVFAVIQIALGLAQGEAPVGKTAGALLSLLGVCVVLAAVGLVWPLLRRRVATAPDRPPRWSDWPGVVLGVVVGAGLTFLCAGYLGIPVELF